MDTSSGITPVMPIGGGYGDGFGGSSFMWIFGLLILLGLFNGGFGFGGGGNAGYVTQADLSAGLNNVTTQNQLQGIALSSANNNYETAMLINGQTNALMQQNNTNLVNAIQGFNQIGLTLQNQTNVLSQSIQALSAKLDDCCCSIKTQMLQNRLDDAQAALVSRNADISNYNQSQYILGQMGKWVANPAATAAAA